MRFTLPVALSGLLLTACTTTLDPVRVPLASNPPTIEICAASTPTPAGKEVIYADVSSRDRLHWMVCELYSKADANLNQARSWENRTEWRDIPLLGAAATVAGLLLFGERTGANHVLKGGEQDAISQIGFGAAAFTTFANYLSPQTARRLLRQGARGHFCMAAQGEKILLVEQTVVRPTERRDLASSLASLNYLLATNPGSFGKLAEAQAIRDAAQKALALYDLQVQQIEAAPIHLGEVTWDFGIDLMTNADRSTQNVDQLVTAIRQQTESVTKFASVEGQAGNSTPKALVSDFVSRRAGSRFAPTPDQLTLEVAGRTAALIDGLVNVEALVLGFDACSAAALSGGDPRSSPIQRVALK